MSDMITNYNLDKKQKKEIEDLLDKQSKYLDDQNIELPLHELDEKIAKKYIDIKFNRNDPDHIRAIMRKKKSSKLKYKPFKCSCKK